MPEPTPFYLDWSFWTALAAALALVLSQLPPVYLWFKSRKLDIEAYSRIAITHKVGNPNATTHIILNNSGGRKIRVKGISLVFVRNGSHAFTLPVQNYYEKPDSVGAILFTPFSLIPGEEWSHSCNFLNYFSRDDERAYRELESNLRIDIQEKRAHLPETQIAVADTANVQPLISFFESKFCWFAGEYEVTVKVNANKKSYSKRFRFTIFESESEVLRALTNEYQYGAGIFYDRPDAASSIVAIELHEIST